MAKKVVYKGKEYQSLRELSKEIGVNYGYLTRTVKGGVSIAEAIKNEGRFKGKTIPRKVVYNGKEYRSLSELAKAVGVRNTTLAYRIKRGMSVEEAVGEPIEKKRVKGKVRVRGKVFESYTDVARHYGMNVTSIFRKLDSGMTLEEAVDSYSERKKEQRIAYNGKTYKNLEIMARDLGISSRTLRDRLNKGLSVKEAIETPLGHNRNARKVMYRGTEYKSMTEFARVSGIGLNRLRDRIAKGMSLEEAVEDIKGTREI